MTTVPPRDLRTDPLLRDVPDGEGHKVLDGRYVLFEVLGRGGMGVVYRAHHLGLDVEVAIKCLDPSLAHGDEQFVLRFEREARAAARVKNAHVVAVQDVSWASGLHYIAMEFVAGENARQRVQRKGGLALGEALAIALGASRGLAAAHSAGLVHRDVKPDNILVSCTGEVKIADLGLAKFADDGGMTATG
ncbi:MAG: serine/threonine protein kinase, partial [Pseudohongiellaceae bacterium]